RMKFAVIVHHPFILENHVPFCVDRDQNVPGTVARSSRMRDEIGVDPFDRVADMRGDLCEYKAELFHLHLYNVCARHTRAKNENERAERLAAYKPHGSCLI